MAVAVSALAFGVVGVVGACGGSSRDLRSAAADAQTTVLSLEHADCAACAEDLTRRLLTTPGVYRAWFDRKHAEISVEAQPRVDVLGEARRLAAGQTFEIVLGKGKGGYLPWPAPPAGADARIVDVDGHDVPDLAPLLAPGKVTVIDFSATWCEPCRRLDQHMTEVVIHRPDVAYRKLDVVDWDTPLARHWLATASELPYVVVYGKRGEKIDVVTGYDAAKLDAIIAKAQGPDATSASPPSADAGARR